MEGHDLLTSFQQSGQSLGQLIKGGKAKLAKLNYIDIKLLLDRRTVKNKKGSLLEKEIQILVKDWHDRRAEDDLRQETIEMETKAMENKLRRQCRATRGNTSGPGGWNNADLGMPNGGMRQQRSQGDKDSGHRETHM
jgi:hypothetical protein